MERLHATQLSKVRPKTNNTVWAAIVKELAKNKYLYILAVPVILYYLIFCYGPMCGIVLAFKQFDISRGIFGGEWVGLQYFKEFFSGIYFTRTLKNTLVISFYSMLWGFPIPIIFALLLNELRQKRFKAIVQTTTYLPHFISLVVVCGMILNFFSTDGIVSRLIAALGGKNMNYVNNPATFRAVFVGTSVWQEFGWNSIIYLTALTGVDTQLYEAAKMDGAGRLRQVWHITLPGITNTIVIMLIMRFGSIMSVNMEKILLLYTPITYEVSDVISSYVYRVGIGGGRYSYSTAVGLFQSVVNISLVFLANAMAKKVSNMSLF